MFKVILNQHTPAVKPLNNPQGFIQQNQQFLLDFLSFAQGQYNCAGLAANQCEFNGNRIMYPFFAYQNNGLWQIVINPIILPMGLIETKIEGCLTYPGQRIIAQRHRGVYAHYYNINGMHVQNEFYKGFTAQVWQHECNHLNGVQEIVVHANDTRVVNHRSLKYERNAPCPCGSGKKYKQCCGPLDC